MCINLLVSGINCFLGVYQSFYLLFYIIPWALKEGDWWRYHISDWVLQALSACLPLHSSLSFSAYFPAVDLHVSAHLWQEEASLIVVREALIYWYSRMLLGIILLLFLSSICFLAGPIAWLVLGSWQQEQFQAWVAYPEVGHKSNQRALHYFHNVCATIALRCLTDRSPLYITGFVCGLVLTFLLW